MKDKSGKEITGKEFMQRWKQGIKDVSPLQQTKISLVGSWLVIGGVVAGIVTSIIIRSWWLLAILAGSLLITGISLLGMWQKYAALKKIDEQLYAMEVLNNEQQSTSNTSSDSVSSDRGSDGIRGI